MHTTVATFFEFLVSPACIVSRDLTLLKTNAEFLSLADITQQYVEEDTSLYNCIDIEILKKNPDLLNNIFTQKEQIKRQRIKGRNSKGIHLSLEISIVPAFIFDPSEDSLILIFSEAPEEKIIHKRYRELYEKEKNERKKAEEFNIRLNDLIESKSRELRQAHQELEKNNAALNSELEIAKSVQTGLLPGALPELTNLEVSGVYVPAEQVGGDMYDIFQIADNKTVLFIYDVSGHGVPSALICAMAKMLFTHHIKNGGRPSEIFAAVNRDMCAYLKTGHYLTAFLGIINHSDNTMIYSQAGHVYPLIYRSQTGKASFISGNSVFIGHVALADIATYHDDVISLDWNDKLVFYTDGLSESANDNGELYGTKRLHKLIETHGDKDPHSLVQHISQDNEIFRNNCPLPDDLTIFCVQVGCTRELLDNSGFTKADRPEVLILRTHDEIEQICSTIMGKMDKKGYSNIEIFQAHQSIHEILANAIQHGNKFNPQKKVFVLYSISLDNYAVSVIDEGDGFNINNVPNVLTKENITRDRGRGLHIVNHYMDKVAFNDKGNRILIGKHQKQVV